MYDDTRDVLGEFESYPLPRLTRIHRLVHAISVMRHHATGCMLPHADVYHVPVAFRDRDGTDRTGLEKSVGYIPPGGSHIIRLPKTPTRRTHVISSDVTRHTACRDGAPPAEGTDRSPLQRAEHLIEIWGDRRFFRLCVTGSMHQKADEEDDRGS